ncbi:acetyl-CoA acetyltransferase [Povalibacter sp.]|uniref:acetyl-CoA acetyltransferase n=1 Tax=Povalibacter sp. TaxID=1962978 RepID=UPI0032C229F3
MTASAVRAQSKNRRTDVTTKVYILGGYQTDFAENWARNGMQIADGMRQTIRQGLVEANLEATQIEVAHVGNFAAELFCQQGHLGGLFAASDPAFAGIPASRHEGACASGSLAILAASADLEARRYGLAAVLGVEQMRNVPGDKAAQLIGGPAMWSGHEYENVRYPWPSVFSDVADEYDRRFGLKQEHLARIAEINFANGRRNRNAQTRRWTFTQQSFTADDTANPTVAGRMRKQDCGQITDGAAIVFLASEEKAREHAKRLGISIDAFPYIRGWGHRTAPITYAAKVQASQGQPYVFPHVRGAITDAFRRAGLADVKDLDGIETHDCFTSTEYMAIDHFGITLPGQSWQAVEAGDIEIGGRIPVNPSGGLIGLGHPVGATGVRMALDCFKQVTGTAGEYQVEGARNFATLNIGGSATTTVSLVVSRD